MRAKSLSALLSLILACTAPALPAAAAIQSAWPLLGFARDNGCELELTGNGKFIELRAAGFVPGESLDFSLTNGDMKPVRWTVFAGASGTWSKLYIPFRFGEPGGIVAVSLDSSRCSLTTSAPWQRGVVVHD